MKFNLVYILKCLFCFSKGKKKYIFFGTVLYLIFFFANSLAPILTRYIIDSGLNNKSISNLKFFLLLSVILIIIISITGVLSNYIIIKNFQTINNEIKKIIFNKITKVNEEFLIKNKSGEINYRLMSDIDSIDKMLNILFITFPIDILTIIGLSAIILSWNIELAVFILSIIIIQTIIVIRLKSKIVPYYNKHKINSQEVSGLITEYIRNINLIKGIGMEENTKNNIFSILDEIKSINIKSNLLNSITVIISNLVNNLWTFGLLLYGGMLIIKNNMSIGELMAFIMISGMLYPRFTSIFNNFISYQNIKISFIRVMGYYNLTSELKTEEVKNELNIKDGELSIKNLTFGYSHDNIIIDNINLKFKTNTITAIVGENGCGKTTLCKLMARFFDPIEGSIYIDGNDISKFSIKSLRKNILYQPQNQYLLSGTIRDNITCGDSDIDYEKMITTLKKVRIDNFINNLPNGLDTVIGESEKRLSGGQSQKIALARIYYNSPSIILLDEPTSFIDSEGQDIFNEIITDLKKDSTIIVVAHNKKTIDISDEVINLKRLMGEVK